MGAFEAALRGKPVIITSYGGLKEYVRTPFVVDASTLISVGVDDFLFTKDLMWGRPLLEDLIRHMRTCAEGRITEWNHDLSKGLLGEVGPALLAAEACSA
jgi:hypothetical protein